jgi:putative phosphoesterase
MKLGLLSDTHGHQSRTTAALRLLRDQGVNQLIHCGDIGSDLVLDLLLEQQETGLPVTVVPGNVDEWDPGLLRYGRSLGFDLTLVARLHVASVSIAVHHGHHPDLMQSLTEENELDLLFTGHTHVARDETVGTVRVINPGAVYRAQVPSVAVLNLDNTMQLDVIPLT